MSFRTATYVLLFLSALWISPLLPQAASAQVLPPRSPNAVRAYFTGATGPNVVLVVWSGTSCESDSVWMGYRVRRDIYGITQPSPTTPFGEVAGQFKAKDTVTDLCLSTRFPCDLSQFVFYGSGIFFRGFRNNRDSDGSYLIDYPPGAPVDSCDSCRVFVDPANLGGFTSRYAVTSIDTVRITNSDFTESAVDPDEIVTVVPSSAPADNLEKVGVVPNPFKGSAEWDPAAGENRVHFIHLMSGSTVRVFTTSGDLVREMVHDPNANPGGTTGDLEWDLRNAHGNAIVSGIYIYQVESPQGHTTRGHFVVIR